MKTTHLKLAAIAFVLALFGLASCIKAQSTYQHSTDTVSSSKSRQNAIITGDGNYAAATNRISPNQATATGKTFTDSKGNVYPVFKSAAGKLYYIRTSANTGNQYKVYLNL